MEHPADDLRDLLGQRRREEQVLALLRAGSSGCGARSARSPCRACGRLRRGRAPRPCERSTSPRSVRSMRRPGVATSTSTPALTRATCGPYFTPPTTLRCAGPCARRLPRRRARSARELARRRDDERERRAVASPDALHQRQRERGGLARAGLSGGDDVATFQDERDGLFLYRGGLFVAERGDCREDLLGKAEFFECHGTSIGGRGLRVLRPCGYTHAMPIAEVISDPRCGSTLSSWSVILIYEERDPSTTLAWALGLMLLPGIGLVFYLLFGRNWRIIGKRDRHRIEALRLGSATLAPSLRALVGTGARRAGLAARARAPHLPSHHAAERHAASCRPRGSRSSLRAPRSSHACSTTSRQATDHVHLEYFIWESDELTARLCALLAEKVRAGVEVRVLYDWVGSLAVRQEAAQGA